MSNHPPNPPLRNISRETLQVAGWEVVVRVIAEEVVAEEVIAEEVVAEEGAVQAAVAKHLSSSTAEVSASKTGSRCPFSAAGA